MDIRENLARCMQDRAVKKKTVAERAGMTPHALYDVLQKRRELKAQEMIRLCEVIGIRPENLATYGQSGAKEEAGET